MKSMAQAIGIVRL